MNARTSLARIDLGACERPVSPKRSRDGKFPETFRKKVSRNFHETFRKLAENLQCANFAFLQASLEHRWASAGFTALWKTSSSSRRSVACAPSTRI